MFRKRSSSKAGLPVGDDLVARKTYGVTEVFTPTTWARVNFIPRPACTDRLVNALATPGMQVVVYGETGSGKSTLLNNELKQMNASYITTSCLSTTTFAELLLDAFDRLDPYYVDTVGTTRDRGGGGQLGGQFLMIRASVQAQASKSTSEATRRVLPPQLTPQRLAEFLGAQGLCWVIEDFHKVPNETKRPLAETFKIFSDHGASYPGVKIVAVGATDTAREVVEYDSNMTNRVAEVLVPLMTMEELRGIINRGQELLNVDFTGTSTSIAKLSVGLAAVCHRIALNACVFKRIKETSPRRIEISSKDVDQAVKLYLEDSMDTAKAVFNQALTATDTQKGRDDTRLILRTLARGPIEGMETKEILAGIRANETSYPKTNVIINLLKCLATGDNRAIIRYTADERFRFAQPVYHVYAQGILGVESVKSFDELKGLVSDSTVHDSIVRAAKLAAADDPPSVFVLPSSRPPL